MCHQPESAIKSSNNVCEFPNGYSSSNPHSWIIRVRICTLNDSGNFCEIPSRSTAQSRRLQKKTTVKEFTAKTMSQLLYMWENAVTGEQSNNKEFATDYYCYGSLCTYTSTHLMWRERLEMSSLNLKGILMEAMEASSMRGFPAMHVARMSSCSLCRSIRSVICPGRLLPLGEEPPKSVGKARGRWLRLWINCSRSLHLGKRGGKHLNHDTRWCCMQHMYMSEMIYYVGAAFECMC